MRWKNNRGPSEFLQSEKTFLVIKDSLNALKENPGDLYVENKSQLLTPRSKPHSAAANAGTWPPKIKKIPSNSGSCSEFIERPKTANLEEPSFLDPRLVDKLDMSILSKELLFDSMTHIRMRYDAVAGVGGIATDRTRAMGIERRRQSLGIQNIPIASGTNKEYRLSRTSVESLGYSEAASNSGILSLARQKRKSFEPVTDSEAYHCRDTSPDIPPPEIRMKKQSAARSPGAAAGGVGSNETITKRSNSQPRNRDDNNNKKNPTPKVSALTIIVKKKSSKTSIKSDVEVFTGAVKGAPEPCKTCGRSDQPERFHSHPKNAVAPPVKVRDITTIPKPLIKTAIPKSVQKPVALNFRSEKRKSNKTSDVPEVVPKNPIQNLREISQTRKNIQDVQNPGQSTANSSPKRGPRSVTCYICSREFGTASFPIHEPKCLQKWERENNALPPSQRRAAPPQRPTEVEPGHQDWNKAAWEQSQAQLLPCSRCGRTFLPDRLPVHEKSCKTPRRKPPSKEDRPEDSRVRPERPGGQIAGSEATLPKESLMVFCQICGRNFGSRSIKIHEPQCLKRWQAENEGQPPPRRKKDTAVVVSTFGNNPSTVQPQIQLQKKTIPCYICGRDFGSTSIAIHEPQCLRKWHQENEKLPPSQRRREPQKPDIIFTRDGTGAEVIDLAATAEANWQSHLGQLVPCKRCGRTFNPDRVAIHERGCKGTH